MTHTTNLYDLFKNQANIYTIEIVQSYDFYNDLLRKKLVFLIHSDNQNKTIDTINKILSDNNIETYNNREEDKFNFIRLSFTLYSNDYDYICDKVIS